MPRQPNVIFADRQLEELQDSPPNQQRLFVGSQNSMLFQQDFIVASRQLEELRAGRIAARQQLVELHTLMQLQKGFGPTPPHRHGPAARGAARGGARCTGEHGRRERRAHCAAVSLPQCGSSAPAARRSQRCRRRSRPPGFRPGSPAWTSCGSHAVSWACMMRNAANCSPRCCLGPLAQAYPPMAGGLSLLAQVHPPLCRRCSQGSWRQWPLHASRWRAGYGRACLCPLPM